MKKLFILAFLSMPVLAQVPNATIILVSSDPSGSCTVNLPDEQVIALGTLYSCQSGTWTQITGGGGGSPAFSAITGGTNTSAAMVVGSGASLAPTGSGTIGATSVANTGAVVTNSSFFIPFLGANTTSSQATNTATNLTYNPFSGTTSLTTLATGSGAILLSTNKVSVGTAGDFQWSSSAAASGTVDTTICKSAAGLTEIGSGTTCNSLGGLKVANVVPGIIYSAAGTALPTCNSGISGEQAVVSDATAPLYMTAYTSGSTVVAAVICSTTDGTTFSWKTH